jgi:hypothetical protein
MIDAETSERCGSFGCNATEKEQEDHKKRRRLNDHFIKIQVAGFYQEFLKNRDSEDARRMKTLETNVDLFLSKWGNVMKKIELERLHDIKQRIIPFVPRSVDEEERDGSITPTQRSVDLLQWEQSLASSSPPTSSVYSESASFKGFLASCRSLVSHRT